MSHTAAPKANTEAPLREGAPVSADTHEVFAIRYGHHRRVAAQNFINPPADAQAPMPMDYFVWLIRCADGSHVVVDTGFNEAAAARRGREFLGSPLEGLARLGVAAASVSDVVVTHLHYDHAGNTAAFPNARFWLQERELQFSTGKYMCHDFFRLAYDAEDVAAMVGRLFHQRVQAVDGDAELKPGISLHLVGGHTAGLQVVRVRTPAGWVVLASDLFHYYANRDQRSPFPIVYRPEQTLEAFARVGTLASSEALVVPGHDPLVMTRFAREPLDADFTVRLWEPLG